MKYRAVIANGLSDRIQVLELHAKDCEDAEAQLEDASHNFDYPILLNSRQWANFRRIFKPLSKDEKGSLKLVLDYLKDEEKHYYESMSPRNHVWLHVKKLRRCL